METYTNQPGMNFPQQNKNKALPFLIGENNQAPAEEEKGRHTGTAARTAATPKMQTAPQGPMQMRGYYEGQQPPQPEQHFQTPPLTQSV